MRSRDKAGTQPRRDFLKTVASFAMAAAGALGLAGVARFLTFEGEGARPTRFEAGRASDFGANSRTRLAEVPAIVLRGSSEFAALSLVCTHLGCTVEDAPTGFHCPCHGSRYGHDGAVTRGPAVESLRQLRTEVTPDGILVIHTD
jgi:cytochrome b6-f complex iron-sulfur subunit